MAYLDKGKGANFETFSEVAEALKNGGWVQPCLHHALMWAKLCLRLWCAVEPCCAHAPVRSCGWRSPCQHATARLLCAAALSVACCAGIAPRADMDFAYVHDAKLVKECGSDCKSPFVIIYKQGESESPR